MYFNSERTQKKVLRMVSRDPMPYLVRLSVVSVGEFIHLNHRALVPACQNTAGITYLQMSPLRRVHFALLSDFPALLFTTFSDDTLDMERFFQASKCLIPPFSANSHPSVQNRSTLQLIYHYRHCDNVVYHQLVKWAQWRHPDKNAQWRSKKSWRAIGSSRPS